MADIQLLLNGDDIWPDVEIRSARFIGKSNGGVGSCSFRVRDLSHVYTRSDFRHGSTLELMIDGTRRWDGYIMGVGRDWAFDADDTTQPLATPRFWRISGPDRNILLQRRFVYNVDDPADAQGLPTFPAETSDRDAILAMHADFLDVSGTGINITDGIDEVASPGPYEKFKLASVGLPWGTIYEDAAKITGAVYYIRPTNRRLIYTDDVTVTAPKPLCDRPSIHDPGEVNQYREMEDGSDSMEMANDALVWGAGRGSAAPVYGRYTDDSSITDHGLWQWTDQWVGANKNETVERRARTYVEGSASHQRGHNEELPDIKLTTFAHGYMAGQVVDLHHHVFDHVEDIPIREVAMTFPTHQDVRYDLIIKRDYDTPFGAIDDWGEDIPGGPGDPGGPGTSGDGETIDEFDREWYLIEDGPGWGTATNGSPWLYATWNPADVFINPAVFVDGEMGWYTVAGVEGDAPGETHFRAALNYEFELPFSALFRFRSTLGADSHVGYQMSCMGILSALSEGNPGPFPVLGIFTHLANVSVQPTDPGDPDVMWLDTFAGEGTRVTEWVRCRVSMDADGYRASAWFEDDSEPLDWLIERPWSDEVPFPSGTGGEMVDGSVSRAFVEVDWTAGQIFSGTDSLEIDWIRSTDEFIPGQDITSGAEPEGGGWNGYDNNYQTRWPYAPGSLEVVYQGTSLRAGIDFTEVDPTNGIFRLNPSFPGYDAVNEMMHLTVRYQRVGSKETEPVEIGGSPDVGPNGYYRPKHQQQLGWGTAFDGTNCVAASGAMALDRHTEGRFSPTSGRPRSIPPNIRYYSGNTRLSGGLNTADVSNAWRRGWNQTLLRPGWTSWNYFVQAVREGRGAIVFGLYSALPSTKRFSRTFRGAHGVYCNEQLPDGNYLVYDPLANRQVVYTPAEMRRYMTAFTGLANTVQAAYTRAA